MSVQCVTFDLDDTLWECDCLIAVAERVFYQWLEQSYPRIGVHYSLDDLVDHRREYFTRYPEMRHDFTYLRKRWLAHLADAFECGPEFVEHGFNVFWQKRNDVTLFEGVPTVLAGLRDRYAVGAITNGNADVHYIGIGHYFDFVVTAAQAGAAKPEPEIFHAALEAAGVDARRSVHVGDDAVRDVRGAGAVGMRTVWVNAHEKPWPGGPPPDATIRSLGELEAVLGKLDEEEGK